MPPGVASFYRKQALHGAFALYQGETGPPYRAYEEGVMRFPPNPPALRGPLGSCTVCGVPQVQGKAHSKKGEKKEKS